MIGENYFRKRAQRKPTAFRASAMGVALGSIAAIAVLVGGVSTFRHTSGGGGPTTFTVTDARCPSASNSITGTNADGMTNSCPMVFTETTLDEDPCNAAAGLNKACAFGTPAYNDPEPGLLAANVGGTGLTALSTMTGACTVANASSNCGWKSHYTTADNGATYYFKNCTGTGLIDDASTVTIYYTNCEFDSTGDTANGTTGRGGHQHLLHDWFNCTQAIGNIGTNHPVVLADGGSHTVMYSWFQDCTDNVTVDTSADIEWNRFDDKRTPVTCGDSTDSSGCHSDATEFYGGAGTVTIMHNLYQGIWDSTTCIANVTAQFGGGVGNGSFKDNKCISGDQGATEHDDSGITLTNTNMTFTDASAVAGDVGRLVTVFSTTSGTPSVSTNPVTQITSVVGTTVTVNHAITGTGVAVVQIGGTYCGPGAGAGATGGVGHVCSSGYQATGGQTDPQSGPITNIVVDNNDFYANPSHSAPNFQGDHNRGVNVCTNTVPSCITSFSGNKQIDASGTVTSYTAPG